MAIALILVCGPLTSDRVEAAALYAVDWGGGNSIYTVDLSTGAASLLSVTSLGGIGGIAFDDDGTLHAIDIDFVSTTLYQIHPPTGASSVVGLTGTTAGEGGLTYDASASLFYSKANAISGGGVTLELISISPTTGAATTIGNMGLNLEADVSGIAPLSASTLLAYDSQSALDDRMLSIDKATGIATVIGPTGMTVLSSVGGLALDPDTGTYYMSNGLSLFTVDPGTGDATLIGPHGVSIAGLAFGPPVSCMIGLDMTSNLYDISAADGSGSNIRLSTQDQLGGLALAPDGTLYAARASAGGELYTLDIVTGAATLVGGSLAGIGEGGLDFDPTSGDLYGASGAGVATILGQLYTVDTSTGFTTPIGQILDESSNPIDASALAFDSLGNLYVLKTGTSPELYEVDPADASVISMVPITGFPPGLTLGGMEFDDITGTLYVAMNGVLAEVDPTTGVSTILGPTPATSALEIVSSCSEPLGVAPVPTMTGWGWIMLTAGFAGAGSLMLRRRAAAST